MEIVSSVVGKLTEYAIDPLLCQVKHIFCYNSKIQTLGDKVKDLQNTESKVRKLVDEAKRNVLNIEPEVKDWLQNVDEIKKKADEVFKGATNSEMQCLFLPNLKTRYLLGRKATKKTAEVAKLQEKGESFKKVGVPKPPVQIPYQNPGDFGAFETRISIKKEIMDALKDKDVSIIGICGMGGVGKTTMANEIAHGAKVDKLFDEFAWADVSQDPNITNIQDQLAGKLGLKIKEITDKYERAERLRERLGGDRSKSILIILDDVWEDTVLETIGVPLAGADKGLKILLTSRDRDVCKRMKAQRIFDVDILNEKESWELFKEKAEISDDATDVIKDTAEKIAKECDGLPLALVIVGRGLSKKAEHAWKNALEELRNSRVANIKGMHNVYIRIRLSYNCLDSDDAKSLLLLCSLFPKDVNIGIGDLVRYAWGQDLFEGIMTLNTARDRVNTIVDDLKSCYLLLSTEDKDCVRLHDIVREVCLQIASKDSMSKHIGLVWPKHDNSESYSAISLTSNELNQLPSGLEYPNLKFLGVRCNQQSLNMPKEFFAHMNSLEVLDLTSMGIQIPSSIQSLTNLRTLCLDHCKLNFENSTIGNLKKLEVLSFFGSDLDHDHFPEDIAELSNLRLMDLRLKHRSSYCPLPSGILLQLKKLEELYLGVVEIRDGELEQRGYIFKEISSLTDLKTFQISTNNPQFLLQILPVCIDKLERFHIELTDFNYARKTILEHFHFGRRLHIRSITYASELSQLAINSLMWRTDHFSIKMEGKNILDEDGFEYLNENHPTGAFDGLQEIYLNGIPKMKHLFIGVIKPPSLHNLTTITIESCPSLKSLFSESAALCMVNLQELHISHCEMLEEIVSMDTVQNEVAQMLEFPKLQHITLEYLDNLKSFRCGSSKIVGVLSPLFKQVMFPNLEGLFIGRLGSVKILDELRQIRSHKLRELRVADLNDVYILFDYTKDDAEISILSQLKSLSVITLPQLVHITRMFPRGICIFENLTSLTVARCDNLRYLFSPSMANSLVALEHVLIQKCEAIEVIIGIQEEYKTSNIEIVEEGTTSRIVFPKLRNLRLIHLYRFRLLSSQNYELVFPSLEYLRIENCPMMTKLCPRQLLSAPKLDKVWIKYKQSVDVSNFLDSEGSMQI